MSWIDMERVVKESARDRACLWGVRITILAVAAAVYAAIWWAA